MNDKEEAIRDIECVEKYLRSTGELWYADILSDAIELLKDKEPFEPLLADADHKMWICGNCKVAIFPHGTSYCHNCGKVVLWNDHN